jgi:hypothetical protein
VSASASADDKRKIENQRSLPFSASKEDPTHVSHGVSVARSRRTRMLEGREGEEIPLVSKSTAM